MPKNRVKRVIRGIDQHTFYPAIIIEYDEKHTKIVKGWEYQEYVAGRKELDKTTIELLEEIKQRNLEAWKEGDIDF